MRPHKILPGIYRHYKNGQYRVLGLAKHTETGKSLVIYHDNSKVLWARPYAMFTENIEVHGREVPRFKLILPDKPQKE